MLSIGLSHYLIVGAVLFCSGLFTMMIKRNAIGILIGVELVINAAALNFVAFWRYLHPLGPDGNPSLDGFAFAMFIIVLAAAEAAVALAIFLNFYHNFRSIDVDQADSMKG